MNEHYASDLDEDDGIKLLDILQTLSENARLLVFGPLLAGLVALGVTFLMSPKYIASTSLLVPQQQGAAASMLAQLGALAGMAGMAGVGGGPKSPGELYVGLLRSRTVADRMVDRFGMMKLRKVKTREDAREILEKVTAISVGRDGLITIKVVSFVPQLSADMANAYVSELALVTNRLAVTEAQGRRQFYEKELAKIKDNLAKAEIALGGVGVGESTLKFNPAAMGEGLATLQAHIMAKELQLSGMRGYLTENSPDFRRAQQELAALRAQLGKLENTRPAGDNAEYINRYREFKYQEVLFEQISKQYELAKIDELSEGAAIQVVDVAVPPQRKANLHKAIVALLAAVATGLVLLVYVFARRALKADQSPEDAARIAAIRAGFAQVLKPWRRHAGARASG